MQYSIITNLAHSWYSSVTTLNEYFEDLAERLQDEFNHSAHVGKKPEEINDEK